jgi:hypothetical protein
VKDKNALDLTIDKQPRSVFPFCAARGQYRACLPDRDFNETIQSTEEKEGEEEITGAAPAGFPVTHPRRS